MYYKLLGCVSRATTKVSPVGVISDAAWEWNLKRAIYTTAVEWFFSFWNHSLIFWFKFWDGCYVWFFIFCKYGQIISRTIQNRNKRFKTANFRPSRHRELFMCFARLRLFWYSESTELFESNTFCLKINFRLENW